jgi:Ca2+/Na+ antiporter
VVWGLIYLLYGIKNFKDRTPKEKKALTALYILLAFGIVVHTLSSLFGVQFPGSSLAWNIGMPVFILVCVGYAFYVMKLEK